jgi:hypothetical protein
MDNTIRWQDGTFDRSRTCIECGKDNCQYPVYKERYKEIVVSKSYKKWEEDNANIER